MRSWTPNEGLPTSTVQQVVQTPDGYLWVSTTGGLARFDGVRFEVFGVRDGLPSNRFCNLLVARDGSLYAVTEDGWLCHWDGARFTSIALHVPQGLGSIVEAADGTLFSVSGQHLWSVRNGVASVLPGHVAPFSTLVIGLQGTLWLTALGEVPVTLEHDRLVPVGPGAPGLGQWILDHRTSRPLFFRSLGRDAELLDTSLRVILQLPGAGSELPQQIDARGRLWMTTGSGVVARSASDGRELQRCQLGLTEQPQRIFVDPEGNIWVCSTRQGLLRVSPSPLRLLRPAGDDRPIEILQAREQSDGAVLATDYSEIVWRVGATQLIPTGTGSFENGDGKSWEGTGATQFRLAKDTIELRDSTGRSATIHLPRVTSSHVIADPFETGTVFLWYGFEVLKLKLGAGVVQRTTTLQTTQEIRDLFIDRNHALWIATASGLWRMAPGDTTRFTRKDGLPVDHVRQIHEDPEGTLWFGTYGGGLVRWKDGRFATLDQRQGLLEDVVSVVLEDDAGEFWLAGNHGLQHFSRRQANECLDGRRARIDVVGLGQEAGLRNPEGSGMPGLRTRDGRLWFPTFDGLAVLDPRSARELTGVPPVPHIVSVSVEERRLPRAARGFVVPPGNGRFDVSYTGFDLRAAEQLRFAYRLDGVDDDWVDAGANRVVRYTNVSPGRHQFRLAAFSGTGRKSTREDTVTIEVRPQFWQTPWFLLLAVLAAVSIVATGWRVRDLRLQTRAAELQRAVDARTAELAEETHRTEQALVTVEAQATRLEALDRARSRFFASISHEFRTPLTLIHGPLHDVRDGLHGALPPGADQQVSVALDSVSRLHRLVDQLLDAARAEAGELRIERKPRDLVSFLDRLALSFVPLAQRKGITFSRRLPAGPLVAAFDGEALEKVFANLLGNALKFTPAGGHVTLSAAQVSNGDHPAIDVSVSDDGPGIAAEDLPHIFKRFYRAERSVTRMQPGTGLGLALASDMVEQHGGTIRVESREGHGSTFTVRLALLASHEAGEPAATDEAPLDATTLEALADEIRVTREPAAQPAPKDTHGTPVPESEPLVLVVDDNPEVRNYISQHLRRLYRVAEAGDGVRALTAMRSDVPDLVVSDVGMPEMDGYALVSAIRQDPELDFVPVILLTAAASADSRIAGLEGGADDYLTKPFEMRELLARVAQALESRRRLRDRIARAAAEASLFGAPSASGGGLAIGPPAPEPGPALPSRTATIDTAFVRRVREVIESRMGDEDFDVDRLAEAMGMGRTLFYQRVGELLEQTPMTLVMNYRLERAGQMLRAGQGNVGEVAYAVGFRSVAHFSRRFREHHGTTPSTYRRGAAS